MLLRYLILTFLAISLTSCGFQTIYGNKDLGKKLNQIHIGKIHDIQNIPTLQAIELKSALKRELHWSYTEAPKIYTLNLSYTLTSEGAAIQSNSLATRNNLTIILQYELIQNETGKVITKNTLVGVESFDIISSPYSNYVTKEGTAIGIMKALAADLKLRIAAVI